MPELKGTTVRRGGVTAHYWYETIRSVAINAATELRLSFSMSSKGGGYTQVQLEIRPEDFPTILETMTSVDRQAALQAMSCELARQIQLQPERDSRSSEKTARETKDQIERLARDRYIAKPRGEDERERIVLQGVKGIISELNNKTKQM